jgi:hypothetical protein
MDTCHVSDPVLGLYTHISLFSCHHNLETIIFLCSQISTKGRESTGSMWVSRTGKKENQLLNSGWLVFGLIP